MKQTTVNTISYVVLVKALIILIGLFSYHLVLFGDFFYKNNYRFEQREDKFVDLWSSWDGQWYLKIAAEGYNSGSAEKTDVQSRAFFPFYSFLTKLLGFLTGNALAGLIINYIASAIALVFLYYLMLLDFPHDTAHRTFLYMLIFPTAMFFSAVYTEGLFLMLAVLCFYFARKQQWWYAGFAGMFATLTKVFGVFLFISLAMEYWQSRKQSKGIGLHYALFLIPFAFLLHLFYLKTITGDWLAFLHAQGIWQKGSFSFSKYFTDLAWHGFKNSAIDLFVTLLFLVLLYHCYKKLRPSYTAYAAIVLFIPILSGDLMSMSRHVLMSFPSFIILAQWGKNEKINYVILILFAMFLAFFTALFVNNYWVG